MEKERKEKMRNKLSGVKIHSSNILEMHMNLQNALQYCHPFSNTFCIIYITPGTEGSQWELTTVAPKQ